MQKKVEVHCNSPKTALLNKASTFIFEKFLSKFQNIDESHRQDLQKIFKSIKQWSGITDEQYNAFSVFLDHKDIEKYISEIADEYLNVPKNKTGTVSYKWLRSELISKLVKSRAINILQGTKFATKIVEIDGKNFIGVMEWTKQVYFEIQEDINGYYICNNLRSGKKVVFWKDTFEICYTDLSDISVSQGPFDDTLCINDQVIVYQKWYVVLKWEDSIFFEDKFFYYAIDGGSNSIYRIDKKSFKQDVEGTSEYIFKEKNWKYLIAESRQIPWEYALFELTGTLKLLESILAYETIWDTIMIEYSDDRRWVLENGELKKELSLNWPLENRVEKRDYAL